MRKVLDPRIFANASLEGHFYSFIYISSWGMEYPNYRDEPIFPAKSPIYSKSRKRGLNYYNNSTEEAIVACVDEAEVCDSEHRTCQKFSGSAVETPFSFQNRRSSSTPSKDDLVRALLYATLDGSNVCAASLRIPQDLETSSHCTYLECQDGLPPQQWRNEARRWFEVSLARIQVNLINIVHGNMNPGADYENIPPDYRGICEMGKFKGVGWRNVSVVGFLGLLLLALLITMASIRTEDGHLWITVGIKALVRSLLGNFRSCQLFLRPR